MAEIVIQPTEDANNPGGAIYVGNPTAHYTISDNWGINYNNGYYVLTKWLLTALAGKTITSATFTIVSQNTGTGTFKIGRLLQTFDPTNCTWNKRNATDNWNTPGALGAGQDISATPLASITTTSPNGTFTGTINLTELAALIADNKGIMFYRDDSVMTEVRSMVYGTASERPKMTIQYTTVVAPNAPTNETPIDAVTNVILNPELGSSAFSTLEPTEPTHKASQWQIATDLAFSSVVWDSGTSLTNKLSCVANDDNGNFSGALSGLLKLAPDTVYYFRVRHQDSNDMWSAYSTPTSFTTIPPTITPNTQLVETWHGIAEELPAIVSKPSVVSLVDSPPTDNAIDGTCRINTLTNDFYYRSNGTWIKLAKAV